MRSQTRNRYANPLNWTAWGLLTGMGLVVLSPQVTIAQQFPATNAAPLQEFKPQDGPTDPFNSRGSNGASGMMDIIHRAQMGTLKDMSVFTEEQRSNIDDQAAQFRAKQQELLQQPIQPAAVSVPELPTTSN